MGKIVRMLHLLSPPWTTSSLLFSGSFCLSWLVHCYHNRLLGWVTPPTAFKREITCCCCFVLQSQSDKIYTAGNVIPSFNCFPFPFSILMSTRVCSNRFTHFTLFLYCHFCLTAGEQIVFIFPVRSIVIDFVYSKWTVS